MDSGNQRGMGLLQSLLDYLGRLSFLSLTHNLLFVID